VEIFLTIAGTGVLKKRCPPKITDTVAEKAAADNIMYSTMRHGYQCMGDSLFIRSR
jgi:hypothetical protein